MDSDHLTIDQANRLLEQIAPKLRYLNRLQSRMNKVHFPPQDPLFVAVMNARNAMQDLHVAAHYARCKHGVGKPA